MRGAGSPGNPSRGIETCGVVEAMFSCAAAPAPPSPPRRAQCPRVACACVRAGGCAGASVRVQVHVQSWSCREQTPGTQTKRRPLVCIHAQDLVLLYCARGVGTPPCSPCTATSSSPTAPRRSPTTLCPPHGPVVAPTPQCFQPVLSARGDEIRNGRALQCVALAQASPRGGDMWAHPYLQQINEVKARPAQPRHRVSLVLHS